MESHKTINFLYLLKRVSKGLLLIFFLSQFFMCSSRRSLPLKGELENKSDKVIAGKKVFDLQCYKCHPNGEAGLGPALNSNPSPGFLKRFQVRHGLGVMPSFKKDEVSKEEMNNLIAYMKALQHNR